MRAAPDRDDELEALVDRIPVGWTAVVYDGRSYGLAKSVRSGGNAISLYAAELGGSDVISANVWRTRSGRQLRPCEMPAEKVLAFLRGWRPTTPAG